LLFGHRDGAAVARLRQLVDLVARDRHDARPAAERVVRHAVPLAARAVERSVAALCGAIPRVDGVASAPRRRL